MRRTIFGMFVAVLAVVAPAIPATAGSGATHHGAGRGYIGALPVPPAAPAHLGFTASAVTALPGVGTGAAVYQATPTGAVITVTLVCVAVSEVGAGHQLVAAGLDTSFNWHYIRVVDSGTAALFSDQAGVSSTPTSGLCQAESVPVDTFYGEAVITS